jgi:hypothetical protein
MPDDIAIPSSVFKDRSLSVLEILVEYLKDEKKLSYHEIAVLLNRNDRTVWTVYNRARKKRESNAKSKTAGE